MSLIVQKYGGTSVADLGRIKAVAERIVRTRNAGNHLVVVVSAMAGHTDNLIRMAHELSPRPAGRELDLLLTSGERVTSALLAICLESMGVAAISLTGGQAGIMTEGEHTRARVRTIQPKRILREIEQGRVAVAAGFQGVDQFDEEQTLGRGGSDLTAVALAAALKADLCEIYTDVSGVFTADPRIVPEAKCLKRISYDEMMELASLGAKVLQPRSVDLAAKHRMSLVVRSSFDEGEGTLITPEPPGFEAPAVSGISSDTKQSKLTAIGVEDRPGIAATLFGKLSEKSIIVDMIVQNVGESGLTDISITVNRDVAAEAEAILQEMVEGSAASRVSRDDAIAKVSVVGIGMKSQAGVASRTFSSLARNRINIMMISTSEISISVIVREAQAEDAVRALHREFIG
ncbi:MAG: aspartate kinase [bacterium]|nr:aspartate kinase [bacterium]